jgi:hypothetical protein
VPYVYRALFSNSTPSPPSLDYEVVDYSDIPLLYYDSFLLLCEFVALIHYWPIDGDYLESWDENLIELYFIIKLGRLRIMTAAKF